MPMWDVLFYATDRSRIKRHDKELREKRKRQRAAKKRNR